MLHAVPPLLLSITAHVALSFPFASIATNDALIQLFPAGKIKLIIPACNNNNDTYFIDEARQRVFKVQGEVNFEQGDCSDIKPVVDMSDGKSYLLKMAKWYPLGKNEIQFNREQGILEAVINKGGFVMRIVRGGLALNEEPTTPAGFVDFYFHLLAAAEEMHREHDQLHLDFHYGNVIITSNGHWQPIDFGRAVRLSKYLSPGKTTIELAHPDWNEGQVQERVLELAIAADWGRFSQGYFLDMASAMKKEILNDTGKDGIHHETPIIAQVFKDDQAIKDKDFFHMYGFHEDHTDLQKLDLLISVASAIGADYNFLNDDETRHGFISQDLVTADSFTEDSAAVESVECYSFQ